MLGSSDGQLVRGVVMDDLRDGGEGGAVLPQHVTAVCELGELHVHEALTAPDRKEEECLLSQFIPNWNDDPSSRIHEGFLGLEQL